MYSSQQISDLRKEGRLKEAYEIGHALLNENPNEFYIKQAFGWVLYACVKQEVTRFTHSEQDGGTSAEKARTLMLEFARLRIRTPDLLYSQMVGQIAKLGSHAAFLPRLLKWGGIDAFRDEDYQVQVWSEGRETLPLAWRAADAAAKVSVETEQSDDVRRFVLALLDSVSARAEKIDDGLRLHREALLHYRLNSIEEALRAARASVRVKQNEWWRWRVLGRMEAQRDASVALGCYARAIGCCNEMQYAVGALVEAADVARAAGQDSLARWMCREALEERKRHEWRIPEALRSRIETDWYGAGPVAQKPWEDIREWAGSAGRNLYTDEQFSPATFIESFSNKARKRMFTVAVRVELQSWVRVGLATSIASTESDLEKGSPVWVVVESTDKGERVVHLETRPNGVPRDCLEEGYGVVKHQNEKKRLTAVYLREATVVTLPHDEFPDSAQWSLGSPVKVLYARGDKGGSVVQVANTNFAETSDIRCVRGLFLVRPQGFGFIDDTFVPPDLAVQLENGTEVEATAICEVNKKRGKTGWRAIAAQPIKAQ